MVSVTLINGIHFDGIFDSADPNSGSIALRIAKETGSSKAHFDHLNILAADLVSIVVTGLRMSHLREKPKGTDVIELGFQTDTGISGQQGAIKERLLTKWAPSDDDQLLDTGALESISVLFSIFIKMGPVCDE